MSWNGLSAEGNALSDAPYEAVERYHGSSYKDMDLLAVAGFTQSTEESSDRLGSFITILRQNRKARSPP